MPNLGPVRKRLAHGDAIHAPHLELTTDQRALRIDATAHSRVIQGSTPTIVKTPHRRHAMFAGMEIARVDAGIGDTENFQAATHRGAFRAGDGWH
jgi:hypothetical protein